jgi:hypothetical protein
LSRRTAERGVGSWGAQAKQKNTEVDLITGEELATLAKEVVVQPPEIIDQMKKLMGE